MKQKYINLKKEINNFIQDINTVKNNYSFEKIINLKKQKTIEDNIKLLNELGESLSTNSTIEEYLYTTSILEELKSMIFDLNYLIESNTNLPTVDSLETSVHLLIISVIAQGINDPENKLKGVHYSLINEETKNIIETVKLKNCEEKVHFSSVNPGNYQVYGEFIFEDGTSLSSFTEKSSIITVESELPGIDSEIFVEFLDAGYEGGGVINIINNSQVEISTQWTLSFNTAFNIIGSPWGDYSIPTNQNPPHCGLVEEKNGTTTIQPNTVWHTAGSFDIDPTIPPNGGKVTLEFNMNLEEGNEVTECYFNDLPAAFFFEMDNSGSVTPPLPGTSDITIEEVDDPENGFYANQLMVKSGETETFTILEEGEYNLLITNEEVGEITISSQILTIDATLPGRSSIKISDGNVERYIGICVLHSDGSVPLLPDYLSLGTMRLDDPSHKDFAFDYGEGLKNKRIDANYLYLNGGASVPPDWGGNPNNWRFWGNEEGDRVNNYVKSSLQLGRIPTFVWYNLPSGGESYQTNLGNMTDYQYMSHYFDDLQFCLDKIEEEAGGELALLILEPDAIGYMAQYGEDPHSESPGDGSMGCIKTDAVYDMVLDKNTDPHFENTFSGLIKAVNYIIHRHSANVRFGWKVNLWARPIGGYEINHNGPICKWTDHAANITEFQQYRDDIYTEATQINNYYVDAGVLEYEADYLAIDKYGLDGGAPGGGPEVNVPTPQDSEWFWNNEHHNNYLTFTEAIHDSAENIPIILWQMTVGHINGTTENNIFHESNKFKNLNNTDMFYECSTSPFFFGDTFNPTKVVIGNNVTTQNIDGPRFTHFSKNLENDPKCIVDSDNTLITWESHMEEAINVGVVMIMSGAGVGMSTHHGGNSQSSTPTDDYWWTIKSQKYYQNKVLLRRKLRLK